VLYNGPDCAKRDAMLRNGDWLIWSFIGMLVLGALAILFTQLAPQARLRRRRRRSHSRVVAKSSRTMVRLSARAPKE